MYFSCGSGQEFDAPFSISRGLHLAHLCWAYYIASDDLQSSCLLASLALLPVTNPRPAQCQIWWLYPLFLHRRPHLVHDLCHGMLHTFRFLMIAMESTTELIFIWLRMSPASQRVVRRERKWGEERIQKARQILSIKAVSLTINIFAVRAPTRRTYVTGTHSTVRIQTSKYSLELRWAIQMRTTTTWKIARITSTAKLPQYTTQAYNYLSPRSSCCAIKFTEASLCLTAVSVYNII